MPYELNDDEMGDLDVHEREHVRWLLKNATDI